MAEERKRKPLVDDYGRVKVDMWTTTGKYFYEYMDANERKNLLRLLNEYLKTGKPSGVVLDGDFIRIDQIQAAFRIADTDELAEMRKDAGT